jgi:hypothetical protein
MTEPSPNPDLQQRLEAALDAFRSNLGRLLQAASSDEQRSSLLDQYDGLRDGYFEFLRASLQDNAAGYNRAADAASAAAASFTAAAGRMSDVAAVINDAASIVSLIGRLLITYRL